MEVTLLVMVLMGITVGSARVMVVMVAVVNSGIMDMVQPTIVYASPIKIEEKTKTNRDVMHN